MIGPWSTLLGVGIVVLLSLDYLSTRIVRPTPRKPQQGVEEFGFQSEAFTVQSGEHTLGAWLIEPEGPPHPALVVFVHGWSAHHGPMLDLARPLVEEGHEVLVFDVRGHGLNDPVSYATVRHFRDDVMAVAQHVARKFPGRPLVAVGHSLGGAAIVLSAAEGVDWHALVLIAAPHDVLQVTAEYLDERKLPGSLLVNIFRPFWWRRIGGTFGPLTPSRRIAEVRRPILIVQPEHDTRVGRHHAEHLAAGAGKRFHVVPGARHTDVLADPETHRLVLEFLAENAPKLPG